MVDRWVQAVEEHNLVDVCAEVELEFYVFLVAAAEESIFAELHPFRGQQQSQQSPYAPVGFVEPAALELRLVSSNVEVDLLLAVDGVGSLVVVEDILSLLQLQQLDDRMNSVLRFED